MSTCTRCGAQIVWAVTAKRGKPMPLDAEPTPNGTVVMEDGKAVVLDIPDRDLAVDAGKIVWRPHFASCGKA